LGNVTESYVDARSEEVHARTLLDVERTIGRWAKWILATMIAIYGSGIAITIALTS